MLPTSWVTLGKSRKPFACPHLPHLETVTHTQLETLAARCRGPWHGLLKRYRAPLLTGAHVLDCSSLFGCRLGMFIPGVKGTHRCSSGAFGLWGTPSGGHRDATFPYQRPAAEQDHEDDEALKPAVLHDAVAGLAQPPPDFPWGPCGVHSTAGTAPDTACGEGRGVGPSPRRDDARGLMAECWMAEGLTEKKRLQ